MTALHTLELLNLLTQAVVRRNQNLDALQNEASKPGQHNSVPSAIEERAADFTFQSLHAARQSGLRYVQIFGSVEEAAASCDCLKVTEPVEIHRETLASRFLTDHRLCLSCIATITILHFQRLGSVG
jgi:hypothetical protein